MAGSLQPFLIAPLKSGTQTNRKPWLIADDAYQLLRNVYSWRGRVKKRAGERVMDQTQPDLFQQQFTRLRINIGTTSMIGDITITVPGSTFAIGQMFSIGHEYFIVVADGNPAVMLTTSLNATVYTYSTTTGTLTIENSLDSTAVYFYPATPVMHFGIYQQVNIDSEITIAFDTQFS